MVQIINFKNNVEIIHDITLYTETLKTMLDLDSLIFATNNSLATKK